jgi:hypothetical protein
MGMAGTMAFAASEAPVPRHVQVLREGEWRDVVVGGCAFSPTHVREVVERLVREIYAGLRDVLGEGVVRHAAACINSIAVVDDHSQLGVGACIMQQLGLQGLWKPFVEQRPQLFKASEGRLRFAKDSDAQHAAYACQQIEERMAVLYMLGGGAPCRGTEIDPLLVTSASDSRNLFWEPGGYLGILQMKGKASHNRAVDRPVYRVLPRHISHLGLLHLTTLHTIGVLTGFNGTLDASRLHRWFLFPKKSEVVAGTLKNQFALARGHGVTLQQYRHTAKFWMRHLGKHETPGMVTALETHTQFGHARATGEHQYGKSQLELDAMSTDQQARYAQVSKAWHAFIFGGGGGEHGGRRTRGGEHVQEAAVAEVADDAEEAEEAEEAAEAAVVSVLEEERDPGGDRQVGQCDEVTSLSSSLSVLTIPDTVTVSRRAQAAVEKMFGKGSEFRTPFQRRVVERVLQHESLVVRGACGSGKFLTFFVPPLVEDRATIVVCPLRAVLQTHVAFALRHGLRYWVWGAEGDTGFPCATNLVFVSAEDAVKDAFYVALEAAARSMRACRICVDEAHVLQSHSHFRRCMDGLARLGGLNLPIVLLTATCTDSFSTQMSSFFGASFDFISANVNRTNLHLQYVDCSNLFTDAQIKLVEAKQSGKCGICFVRTVEEGRRMQSLLGYAPLYHGSLSPEERERALQQYSSAGLMVATSALSNGVNVNCQVTVVLGCAQGNSDMIQALGRTARQEAAQGHCYLYSNRSYLSKVYQAHCSSLDTQENKGMMEHLKAIASRQCRWLAIGEQFGYKGCGDVEGGDSM